MNHQKLFPQDAAKNDSSQFDKLSLEGIDLGRPQRFPAGYDERHKLYALLLQACQRLKIPCDRWPKLPGFDPLLLPPEPLYVGLMPFIPPPIDLWRVEDWARATEQKWKIYKERVMRRYMRLTISLSPLTKRRTSGPKRDIAPMTKVSEWAVRHYCLGETWEVIARSQAGEPSYSIHQVRRHGRAMLHKLEIGDSRKR